MAALWDGDDVTGDPFLVFVLFIFTQKFFVVACAYRSVLSSQLIRGGMSFTLRRKNFLSSCLTSFELERWKVNFITALLGFEGENSFDKKVEA